MEQHFKYNKHETHLLSVDEQFVDRIWKVGAWKNVALQWSKRVHDLVDAESQEESNLLKSSKTPRSQVMLMVEPTAGDA